jgi:hypothetical protein
MGKRAAQPLQNFAPVRFSVPQAEQMIMQWFLFLRLSNPNK